MIRQPPEVLFGEPQNLNLWTLRLERGMGAVLHRRGPQQDDPGAKNPVGGYAAHYCSIPRYEDPRLAACAYIGSGSVISKNVEADALALVEKDAAAQASSSGVASSR